MKNFKRILKNLVSAYCSRRLRLPKGTIIYHTKNIHNLSCGQCCSIRTENSYIRNVLLGDFVSCSKNSTLFGLKVGKFSCLGPGITVAAGEHPTRDFVSVHPAFYSLAKQYGYTFVDKQKFEEYKYTKEGYNFVIGNDVWIGSNVLLVEGHSIGDGAIVAAGSVVTKDIPPYEIWGGSSAFHSETLHRCANRGIAPNPLVGLGC